MRRTSSDSRDSADRTGADGLSPVSDAFVRHESALKRFIRRVLRNPPDVEDIAQEAFLRAYAVERDRAIEQPKSLLFRIARHVALTQVTRKANKITSSMEDLEDPEVLETVSSAEEEVSARQTLAVHCEAVAELGPQCRHVYLLRKVHGLSHKEIAAHLGIAVSTVEKHLIKGVEQCDRYVRERMAAKEGHAQGGGAAPAGQRRAGR